MKDAIKEIVDEVFEKYVLTTDHQTASGIYLTRAIIKDFNAEGWMRDTEETCDRDIASMKADLVEKIFTAISTK